MKFLYCFIFFPFSAWRYRAENVLGSLISNSKRVRLGWAASQKMYKLKQNSYLCITYFSGTTKCMKHICNIRFENGVPSILYYNVGYGYAYICKT
jgi:hypothetical protein